ncbi:MAG TPA: universal stress protein [Planctomycetota bacterium]|nr:universal stress protein [Planctomycetota bacterium]
MIERMVVPLDGSLTAEAILPQVRRLLYRNDSEIILVRAVEPPVLENGIMLAEEALAAAREYILGKVERFEQQGVRVRSIVRYGSPAGVILDAAESERATMVALATHGATGLKRILFGSVAETVIRKSPVPVLLVRPFWCYELAPAGAPEQRPIRNLLVPVDGLGLIRHAMSGIVEMARLFGTRVVLSRILEGAERRTVQVTEYSGAEAELESIAKELEGQGIETIRLLGAGSPVERILETVHEEKIDMIAMATQGRSGWLRLREGSVTEEVLRRAEVPLLVSRVAKSGLEKDLWPLATSATGNEPQQLSKPAVSGGAHD